MFKWVKIGLIYLGLCFGEIEPWTNQHLGLMRGKDYNLNREDKLVFGQELKNFIKKETNEILFIMSIKAKNDIWSHDNGPSISLRMTFRSSKERTVKQKPHRLRRRGQGRCKGTQARQADPCS